MGDRWLAESTKGSSRGAPRAAWAHCTGRDEQCLGLKGSIVMRTAGLDAIFEWADDRYKGALADYVRTGSRSSLGYAMAMNEVASSVFRAEGDPESLPTVQGRPELRLVA